jgi:hypothetical protein
MNKPNPIEVYQGLREQALNAVSLGLPKPPAEHNDVYGIVIDIPQGIGYVTIVAMCDASTSMYISNGGGIVGAGQKYPEVAKASQALLVRTQHCLKDFLSQTSNNLPAQGTVRFHILTESGNLGLDITEDQFWGKTTITGKQFPMVMAIQQLINAIQTASKKTTK